VGLQRCDVVEIPVLEQDLFAVASEKALDQFFVHVSHLLVIFAIFQGVGAEYALNRAESEYSDGWVWVRHLLHQGLNSIFIGRF